MMNNMILTDVFLFLASIAINVFVFFVLHVIILRIIPFAKLATMLTYVIIISCFVTLMPTYFLFKNVYSSIPTFVVAETGMFISSVFILGFYCFSGPICADRSPSAHMALVLRESSQNELTKEEWLKKYGYEKVFDRRVKDFRDAKIIQQSGSKFRLTQKGSRISFYFLLLIKILKLQKNY